MGRILQVGFELGQSPGDGVSLVNPDGTQSSTVVTTPTAGAWSAYALRHINNHNGSVGGETTLDEQFNFPGAVTEVYLRMHYRADTTSGMTKDILRFRGATGIQCCLAYSYGSGVMTLLAYRGGSSGGTLIGTASVSMSTGSYHTIEIHCKVDPTTGAFEVLLDGPSVLSFTGNTRNLADNNMTFLQFHAGSLSSTTSSAFTQYIDDLSVNDTSGSVNNTWLGDGRIALLGPTAAGDVTQLTIGGSSPPGSNYQAVDEKPGNDGTDYVSGSTSGNRDLYTLSDSPSDTSTVSAVCVWIRGIKSDAGSPDMKALIKSGGTESAGSAIGLDALGWKDKKRILDVDPTDSAAWTKTKVDNLQAGPQVA